MLTCCWCGICIEKDEELVSDRPLVDSMAYCSPSCEAAAFEAALAAGACELTRALQHYLERRDPQGHAGH